MYIWGDNSNHQLGIEGTKFIDSPVMIDSLKGIPIEQVVCNQGYTAALTNDGAVLTWGDPAGQFGKKNVLGHKNKVIVPQPAVIDYFLDNNIKVNKIGGGVDFMNCISEYGDLYSWGDGSYGKLGNGSNSSERTPHNYKYNNELIGQIKDISTGFNATLALTTDNKIFSWGFDDQGQLGIPGQFSSEIKVTDLYPHLIYDKPEPIKKIAIGYGCGAYLTEDGKLTWWGMNTHWEPYVEPVFETGGVVDIVGGHHYFAAIHSNGYLYMWGKKANIPSGMKTKKKLVSPTLNPILADIGQVVQVACAKQRVVAVVRT